MGRRKDGARATVLVAHLGSELYGSDRVLLESVVGLVGGGNRVVVALPSAGPLVAALTTSGARVVICPTPVLRRSVLRPRGMVRLLADTARGLVAGARLIRSIQADVIYVNTVTIPHWVLLARIYRVPVVVHVHEAEESLSKLGQQILTFPLLFATRVVSNSNYTVAVLAAAHHRLSRSTVIYNGIPGPEEVTPSRASLDSTLHLLYIGRLSPRKGLDCVLDAMVELKRRGVSCTLALVGAVFPGYEWYEQQLRAQVTALGLYEQVSFEGFRATIWADLAAADAVVVPSPNESFGNIAVEAILGGRPVITSNAPGLAEATAGYQIAQNFPVGDVEALCRALTWVVDDWPQIAAAAHADIALAQSRHSPTEYHRQVLELVSDMVTK
ncbi:MAG: glycosyltransferase family 4 protein [Microbacteriaceae bacterium]|nr:glycosyltransferase family 4 protein [Microbacteriaceae bacterium]